MITHAGDNNASGSALFVDQVDRRRRRKWVGMRSLYTVLRRPPYRYHSMDRALEAIPGAGYCVSQTAFVGRMMAGFKFDPRLGMDAHLRSLHGCFEGADMGVDYRDILCCMTILRRYKQVRKDPSQLFRDLVLTYADKAGTVMQRKDVLRVCRLGAVHEGEVWQTSSRLDRYLTEAARPHGLKPTFRSVTMTMLIDVMESNPSVLAAFRTQLWQRLPEAWRMGVLAAAETFGMNKAGSSAMAVQQRRATRWYANVLSRKVVTGWKIFRNKAKLVRAQRAAVEKILRRHAVRAWHAHAADTANHRKWYPKAIERGRIVVLRRYFKRITDFVEAKKRLAAIAWAFSKQGKLVNAGVGLLRGVLRKRSMRLALHVWCEAASLLNAWEFAFNLWRERLRRRAFIAFRDLVKMAVRESQVANEADRRAAEIAEALEQAEREKVLLAETAELASKRQKAQAKVALMAERAAAHKARLEAARAESIARDRHVAGKQREARHRRIYEDRVRIHQEFEAEWEIKFEELVKADMEAVKTWLESGDEEATFKVQKELEILKRKFYASPSPETMELERAISDPANAIFAHMAHRLYEKNMSLHQFFTQFDKEGDGYLAHEEFKGMVTSLNIKLSGEKIRLVIRAIDLDGGGYIDFPEFEAAVRRHEEVCGAGGSAWKMYVSPVHAVMTLHNVETNEEIWDFKATAADLLRIVKDNIVGMEGIASKKRVTEQREAAWDSLQKYRAATVIQRQYHARAARKKRALLRWKWDVEVARLKAKAKHNAATTIQCWWRVMRAKWLALQLLQITVEVLFDPGSNQKYYFNHGLGSATWFVPSMLRRWRGPAARMPDVLEWVLISRIYGAGYFYNTRSGLQQNQKPAGYIRCSSCETQLASRRCTMEERDLCFVCYRTEHLEGDEACWHDWKPSKANMCKICGQRDATVACLDCDSNAERTGLVLCDNCWKRSHANPKVLHREPLTIEQWSSNRAGGLGGGGTCAMGREVILTAVAGGVLEDGGFGGTTISGKSAAPAVDGHGWEGGNGDLAESAVPYTGAEQFGHDPY